MKYLIFSLAGLLITVSLYCQPGKDSIAGNNRIKKPASYKDLITSEAVIQRGIFTTYHVEEKWYFEIADSLFEREILIVSRLSKAAADNKNNVLMTGLAGDEINKCVVKFTRGPGYRIFLKKMTYTEYSIDSSRNGLMKSVSNSNFPLIVAAFEINALSPDNHPIIDLTDYISGDNDVFFFGRKELFSISAFQSDKSYIQSIHSYPINLEIRTVKTYGVPAAMSTGKTFELNTSLVLLPQKLMRQRCFDPRIGYFYTSYLNFDVDDQRAVKSSYINRWRLEPRSDDVAKYQNGELVEPEKPIIYYIDPATPKKWVPYLIAGVNDWQKAFEKAGFKNAIYAVEVPPGDSMWNMEDARHNVLVYKPAVFENASGPHVSDPRTGEIIETHLNWYHNVMKLLHDWYFIQAGPIDPEARKMHFSDTLMGQLIRFVSSHEVGHTLGLMHNFGSSSTVPVDSLRSKTWLRANGHTPSIMDYARFNYVAQPEDSITREGIMPRIGIYDEWAIEWGYRWFPPCKTTEEERKFLIGWVTERMAKEPRLWFGGELATRDPRSQSEDLGDNAMTAGEYGIRNLKIVMNNLINWTSQPNEDYSNLRRMFAELITQYKRYLFHVARYIGGTKSTSLFVGQPGNQVAYVPKKLQLDAINFFERQIFTAPTWLIDSKIFSKTGTGGIYQIAGIQSDVLKQILSHRVFASMQLQATYEPDKAFKVDEYLEKLQTIIFYVHENPNQYQRNLQKIYVERLNQLLSVDTSEMLAYDEWGFKGLNNTTDIFSIIRSKIIELSKRVAILSKRYSNDTLIRYHYEDLAERLKRCVHKE